METGDRISELYKGEIFLEDVQSVTKQRIHWMCQRAEGQKVIDIGCSQGIVSILLAREGFEVVGVDIDNRTIEYANSDRAKEPPEVQQRLTFIRGNSYDVDLPDREFHTAIMGEFLEHQVKPEKAITKAYELLVYDGKLIITVPFGLFEDPDHEQTFYIASLYKLIYPYFVITEVELIGGYLCLLCKRREVVLEKQMDSIDLALVERAEQEFQHREAALTKEAERFKAELKTMKTIRAELNTTRRETTRLRAELEKEKRTLQAVRGSLSFRLGHALVRPVHKPGRFVLLLLYRVLCMSPDSLKRVILKVTNKNKMLTSLMSFAETGTLSPVSTEPSLDEQEALFSSFLERFKEVVLSRPNCPFVVISSTTRRIGEANRANRTMMFAEELAATEIPVIYVYYRFKGAKDFTSYSGGYLLQMPNDLFHTWSGAIATWNHTTARLFLCSIPDVHAVSEIGLFRYHGWKVIYEVRDDWEEFHKAGVGNWYDSIYERFLCRQTDLVTTVNITLKNKMLSMGSDPDRTFVVPNGLKRSFLENAKASFARRRSGYRGNGTIGYFGHLTPNWFNWELLLKTASRRPDFRFEIIGFGEPKGLNLPRNVVMLGTKNHEQIIDIASNWSIAIIPFKNTKIAEGVDPIKIYEYLALGLPCVSCWIPQVKDYPLTFIYQNDSKFEEVLEKALKYTVLEEDWDRTEAFIAGSTWDGRVLTTLSLAGIDISKAGVAV